MKRGYESKYLIKICNIFSCINRNDLIPYKEKESDKNLNNFKDNSIRMIINFDLNYITMKNDLYYLFEKLKLIYNWLSNKKLVISIANSYNFQMIFINKFKMNFFKSPNKKCNKENCIYCKYFINTDFIKLNDTFYLPLISNNLCESLNCIYLIRCLLCNVYYIGETKNIKKRISGHKSKIKNFDPFVLNDMEVALHFNLKGHNFEEHFRFYIFKDNINDEKLRFSTETDIINIQNNILNLNILNNKKLHFKYGVHDLTFKEM